MLVCVGCRRILVRDRQGVFRCPLCGVQIERKNRRKK